MHTPRRRSCAPRGRGLIRWISATAIVPLALAACGGDDDSARPSLDALNNGAVVRRTTVPETLPGEIGTEPEDSSPPSLPESSTNAPTTSAPTSTTTVAPTTTIDPASVQRAFPVDPNVGTSWTPQSHHDYPATDIFSTADCGTQLLSPVAGVVDEVLSNVYDRATDNPSNRGGNALSIIGDDGVRYYMAHFQEFDAAMRSGMRVTAGQPVGLMGDTGRAGACHLHFGLSLPCPDGVDDWFIRRGVIWPDQYVDSWKSGGNLSPLPELEQWFGDHPDACAGPENTPYPIG